MENNPRIKKQLESRIKSLESSMLENKVEYENMENVSFKRGLHQGWFDARESEIQHLRSLLYIYYEN